MMIKKCVFAILILLTAKVAFAQNMGEKNSKSPLKLHEANEQVDQNWPVSKKVNIQNKITELNQKIAGSGWLPEVQISARTSYQSDVAEISFSEPGSDSPDFSKDHYNFSLDIIQPVYDGGRTRSLQELEEYSGEAEQARIRSELLTVRSQLEQVWFGILTMQKQRETLQLRRGDIQEQLGMVQTQVRNGSVLSSNEMILKAELIRAEQELTGIRADIRAGYRVLSELMGMDVEPDVPLEIPVKPEWGSRPLSGIDRPEYDLFDAHMSQFDSQKKLFGADKLPSVSIFGTTAYGRPGLNMFEDDLQFYWVVGLRAQWSLKNTQNASLKTDVLNLKRQQLNADRDAFTHQLNAELRQMEEEIEAIQKQIEQDEEVLDLSNQVLNEKSSQLEQGAITSTEYITELNAKSRARLNLEIRKIRLTQAITEYQTKRGNTWN